MSDPVVGDVFTDAVLAIIHWLLVRRYGSLQCWDPLCFPLLPVCSVRTHIGLSGMGVRICNDRRRPRSSGVLQEVKL